MPSANSNTGRSAGFPVEPGRIGRRSGDQVVSRTGRKELLAQCDYVRDSRRRTIPHPGRVQPEHPAVQAAPQMDHGGMRVNGQELRCPDVVLGGAYRHQRRPPVGNPEFAPVVIDSADRFLGEPVAQYGLVEVSVQRLAVQGRQHSLRGPAEVDTNLFGHVAEASVRERRNRTGPRRDGPHRPKTCGAEPADTRVAAAYTIFKRQFTGVRFQEAR